MKAIGSALLGAACIALLLAPSAQAHKLTAKKATAALTPLLEETATRIAPRIAASLPGATIAKSRVDFCDISKRGHRADCSFIYSLAGGPTVDTDCQVNGRAEYRNKRSKKVKTSLPFLDNQGPVLCGFTL